MELRGCFEGGDTQFFFLTRGKQSLQLYANFQVVWRELGLKEPAPSFGGLRSAMATYVSIHVSDNRVNLILFEKSLDSGCVWIHLLAPDSLFCPPCPCSC